MDEDARFPNRKRKNWEPSLLGDKIPEAELQEFISESTPAEPLPTSGYHVLGSAEESAGDQPAAAEMYAHLSATAAAEEQNLIAVSAVAEEQIPSAQPPIPHPPARETRTGRMRKFAESPARVYAAAVVGLGILLGIVFAVTSHVMSNPNGRYDLGTVTSSAAGLEGHLFIQWDKNLKYRLAIKPSDPDQQEEFALAVAHPPRPLSVEIQLKDVEGFVLCSKIIVLKYDAGSAPAPAGNADAGKSSSGQLGQVAGPAQADAQEAAREHGKDVFQNQVDPDGKIVAINAQGDLSCSAEAYEKAENWSFLTGSLSQAEPAFPSLSEQEAWLKRQEEMAANAERPSPAEVATRRRAAAKAAARLLPFSIEGDDAIVDFDTSHGIIQTRGHKTFLVDKAVATAADPGWQDYPVSIHYRCDQSASCTLMHSGAGVLRASLGR
jgi:hypothetical protein